MRTPRPSDRGFTEARPRVEGLVHRPEVGLGNRKLKARQRVPAVGDQSARGNGRQHFPLLEGAKDTLARAILEANAFG